MLDCSAEQRRHQALAVSAAVPAIVAALHRLRLGLDPVSPRTDLPLAADHLRMVHGTEADPDHVRAIEQYLVLGDNASESLDSREFGPVPLDAVVGLPEAVVWPPAAWRRIGGPR